MKTVQIQSKSTDSEYNTNIFYDFCKKQIEGKVEYKHLLHGKEKQYVRKKIEIIGEVIKVDEHFEDSGDNDDTQYIIKIPDLQRILDYDIFEKILKRIDKMFTRLESKEDLKVIYAKNMRKIESKDVVVEINNNKMYIKSKELEIDVNSTSNLIDDNTSFQFYEEYTGEKAKDSLSLINIRIHKLLTPLLYLQHELRYIFT